MVSLSNTYLFGLNTDITDLFRDAYERIGIIGNEQTPLHLQSAIMSANLELSSWPGKGINHWLISRQMFPLLPNQTSYTLPMNTVRVFEVTGILPNRLNLGGTAFSTAGGNANHCFDPDQLGGCIQNAPNGSIGYDYGLGVTNSILYVGVLPLVNANYTLSIEYSFDNVNWIQSYLSPQQQYNITQTTWFVLENTCNARSWRITETGGETLQIQQIYFSQPTVYGTGDRILGPMSRYQYMAQSQKMQQSTQSAFFFDQKIPQSLKIWPVPADYTLTQMSHIVYTAYQYAQDIRLLFQGQQVPQRFYDALAAGLAARLCLKFMPEKYPVLRAIADEAYATAAMTDNEDVPLSIQPNFTGW